MAMVRASGITGSWILVVGPILCLLLPGVAAAADCDGDKIDDAEEIASDPFGFANAFWCDLRPRTKSVDVGDFDGDNLIDVVGLEEGRLLVHPGRPSGGFGVPVEGAAVDFDPAQMVVADFDGDSWSDVALAGGENQELLLFRATDQGRLDPVLRLSTRVPPQYLTFGDFDGDGRLDLVFASNDENAPTNEPLLGGRIVPVLSQGDFLAPMPEVPVGYVCCTIVSTDLDGDGDVDLAFIAGRWTEPQFLRVLRNNGTGLAFDIEDSPPPTERVLAMISSDWDQDGDMDLFLGSYYTPGLALNDGLAHFTAGVLSDLEGQELGVIAVGDLDGDGINDLAAAAFEGREISVFRGLGRGARDLKPIVIGEEPFGLVYDIESLRAIDVNDDGRLDVARIGVFPLDSGRTGIIQPRVSYFVNRGTADCNANGIPDVCEVDCNANGWADDCDITKLHETDCNQNLVPDACEDLDSNHNDVSDECELLRGDLSDCNENGVADLADLAPRFVMGEGEKPPVLLSNAGSPAVADVDGDGDLDLTLRGTTPPLGGGDPFAEDTEVTWTGTNDGGGRFAFKEGPRIPGKFLGALDLDGDGLPEFVFQSKTDLTIAGNDGHGIGRGSTQMPYDTSMDYFVHLHFSDLDGDGDLDVLTRTPTQFEIFLNDGKAHFDERREYSLAMPFYAGTEVLADLDGDGDADLLVVAVVPGHDGSQPLLYSNDGRGRFALAPFIRWIGPSLSRGYVDSDEYAEPIAVAHDFDGDGLVDLAAIASEGDFCDLVPPCHPPEFLWVILNQGTGVFSFKETYEVSHFGSVRVADLENDGDPDLVVSQAFEPDWDGAIYAGKTAQAFLNRGDARFLPQPEIFVGRTPSEFDLADLNGDAYPDLVVGARDPGELRILFNHTVPPRFHDLDHDGVLDECEVNFQRADWNQDAQVDLSDAIAMLSWLFLGAEGVLCEKSGDADDDGKLDLTDPIHILRRLFQGAEPLPEPWQACGRDPTPDRIPCTNFRPCM